jgi:hypothetical protein
MGWSNIGPADAKVCELPVLSAGIDPLRQVGEETLVEGTSDEGRRELLRVDAGQRCAKPRGDHLVRELGGIALPERKHGSKAEGGKLRLAIGAQVGEEQVAEHYVGYALRAGLLQRLGQLGFIDGVRAWPGDQHLQAPQA